MAVCSAAEGFVRACDQGRRPVLSFELFPPKGDLTLKSAREVAGAMAPCAPDFMSVTCSAGGSGNGAATSAIAEMIQDELDVSAVAHLTCINASDDSIARAIDDFKARGILNVLALRGDVVEGCQPSKSFRYACDLIPLLKDAGFCVGAAAYPEGHLTCDDAHLNLLHLREKQQAGADFFVTQLCFDNDVILRFLDEARNAGVTAPIDCGIMPFMSKSQLTRMVFLCGASLPSPVIKLLAKYESDPESLRQAGVEYACRQLEGLVSAGVDGVHVYTMNRPSVALQTTEAVRAVLS